jgi:hypothetical protein
MQTLINEFHMVHVNFMKVFNEGRKWFAETEEHGQADFYFRHVNHLLASSVINVLGSTAV